MRRVVAAIMVCFAIASLSLIVLFFRSFVACCFLCRSDRSQRGLVVEYKGTTIVFMRGRADAYIGLLGWTSIDGTDPDPKPPRGWLWLSSPISQSAAQASWKDFVPVIAIATTTNQRVFSYFQLSIIEISVLFGICPSFYFWKIARRWNRRRTFLCVNCGYDLRAGHDRCPECGHIDGRETRTPLV